MTTTTTADVEYVRPWHDSTRSYVERVRYVERVARLIAVLTMTVRGPSTSSTSSASRADARRRFVIERDSTSTARRMRLAPYYVPPTAADVERAQSLDADTRRRALDALYSTRRRARVRRPYYGAVWTMEQGALLDVERRTVDARRRATRDAAVTGTILSCDVHRDAHDDAYWLRRPWPRQSTSSALVTSVPWSVRASRPSSADAASSYVLGRTAVGMSSVERRADGTYSTSVPITAPAWRERTPRPLIPRVDHRDALDVERPLIDVERVYLLDGPRTIVRRVERRAVRVDHQLTAEARAIVSAVERPLSLSAAASAVLDVERVTARIGTDGPLVHVERVDGRITATLDGATAPYSTSTRRTPRSVREWLLDATALVMATRDRVLVERPPVVLDVDTDADGRLHY